MDPFTHVYFSLMKWASIFAMPVNFKDKVKELHVNNNGYYLLNFTHGGKYGTMGFTGMIAFIPLNNL